MSEGMKTDDLKYHVFFFSSSMPTDLQSLPFDPVDAVDVTQNCHSWLSGLNNTVETNAPGESSLAVSISTTTTDTLPTTGPGLTQENFNVVAYSNYVTQESYGTDAPVFSGIQTWADIALDAGFRNAVSDSEYMRIGFHDSCVVLDLQGVTQSFGSRLYYYTPTLVDQSQLDLVFEDYLATLDAGTYSSTYTFDREETEFDELNNTVYVLYYYVDLVAGGTESVSIKVLKDDTIYNSGYFVSPETAEDKGGFKKHDIAQTDIPIIIDAVQFRQRYITSRQKAPSWSGSALYDTTCDTLRVDTWDAGSNQWLLGNEISINGEGFIATEISPVQVKDFIRFVCVDGLMRYSELVDGDPHWSINHISPLSKASATYPVVGSVETIQWAMVVPAIDLGQKTTQVLEASRTAGIPFLPYVVCEVGVSSTGTEIEVDSVSMETSVPPSITKLDLVFKD